MGQNDKQLKPQAVYIVDGTRTPFLKAQKPNLLSAAELALASGKTLLARQPFPASKFDEVIFGCVAPAATEANIARIIALRLGCGFEMPAYTVQRNCASGLQALDSAASRIASGEHHLVLAGGTECMSRAPLLFDDVFAAWLADWRLEKNNLNKLKLLTRLRPRFLSPVSSLLKGLKDPVVNLSMGQTAEKLAYLFNISREAMDKFSVQSHARTSAAEIQGFFQEELTPLFDWQGNVIDFDTGVRKDSSCEKLAKLKPVFDKPFGNVTAGNSSPISDGAACLILASQTAIQQYNLPVLGRMVYTSWAALDPALMGLGPVHAIAKLLKETGRTVEEIDYWEINEAFAAQVLACLKAMEDENYCRKSLGLSSSLGIIPQAKLNVDGGAIAIGHPVGASGARLVLHLLHILKRNKAKLGIASLCIGGGQGGAVLLENVDNV